MHRMMQPAFFFNHGLSLFEGHCHYSGSLLNKYNARFMGDGALLVFGWVFLETRRSRKITKNTTQTLTIMASMSTRLRHILINLGINYIIIHHIMPLGTLIYGGFAVDERIWSLVNSHRGRTLTNPNG